MFHHVVGTEHEIIQGDVGQLLLAYLEAIVSQEHNGCILSAMETTWVCSTLPFIQYYLIISWYLHAWSGVAVAAYIRLASRSQAKISKQTKSRPFPASVRRRTCVHHGICLSVTRFSLSDLFSAGQAGGFLATATPFHT